MKALLTRPAEDCEGLIGPLAALGYQAVIEPLLEIRFLDDAVIDPSGVQGILVTSANGIRAVARRWLERDCPVWAVGESSAATARALGFTTVTSAGGDVETLADLVRARLDPAAGALLHAAGTVLAGDLSGRLAAAGFTVRRARVYEANAAQALSPETAELLRAGCIDCVLFFSPRTAATFVRLVGAAGLGPACQRIGAFGLSAAVLGEIAGLTWERTVAAAQPTRHALLAAVAAQRTRLT